MDQQTRDFLKTTGLNKLTDIFEENDINFEALFLLTETQIDSMIKSVGLRTRLWNEIKLLQQKLVAESDVLEVEVNGITYLEEVEQSAIDLNVVDDSDLNQRVPGPSNAQQIKETSCKKSCKSYFFLQNVSLIDYLELSCKGRTIINEYKTNKKLDDKDRRQLVHLVIDGMMNRRESLKNSLLNEMAEEILIHFPSESKEIYFSQNKLVSKNAQGKLVDRYKAERSYLLKNKIGLSSATITNKEVSEEVTKAKKFLKSHSKPWKTVIANWLITYDCRCTDINDPSLSLKQILNLWPIIKHSLGYSLVSHKLYKSYSTDA